ncbi:MAG TPA: hypothetical protein ENN09_07155 [Planctomycetes bacterium]|nr:hypothetical protein [Planctomycetota bacterium]
MLAFYTGAKVGTQPERFVQCCAIAYPISAAFLNHAVGKVRPASGSCIRSAGDGLVAGCYNSRRMGYGQWKGFHESYRGVDSEVRVFSGFI